MELTVRQPAAEDIPVVSVILLQATHWLVSRGNPLWRDDELMPEQIQRDALSSGSYFLAEISAAPVATIRFQLKDRIVWPDMPDGEATYVHRMAVRRAVAGGEVSTAPFSGPWSTLGRSGARALGRPYLRLDCDAAHPRLRAIYERFGFRDHSDRQVGPLFRLTDV